MRSYKNVVLLALSLVLAFVVAACGGATTPATQNTGSKAPATTAATATASPQANNGQMNDQQNGEMNNQNNGQNNQGNAGNTNNGQANGGGQNNNQNANDNNNNNQNANNNDKKPAPTAAANGGKIVIRVMQVNVRGVMTAVLASPQGMTLYYRATDPAPASGCTGACAKEWPPLLSNGATIISSETLPGKLTVQQTTHGWQVEYNGHPLYTYTGDKAPGQANGAGNDNVWYVVSIKQQKQKW
ncbi:MAG: hypothetical protein IMW89_15295 [Ktedonobacteraceae bacterium]|nr:hypothetical protein [Ktedonobacteraceae bacterium]